MDKEDIHTHIHTHTHTNTIEYYPAIKNEILVFGTTCMEPECIILN